MNSVTEDLTLNITKVAFNCPPRYDLRLLPSNIDLSVVLIEIKKEFSGEIDWGYVNDLIRAWKLI